MSKTNTVTIPNGEAVRVATFQPWQSAAGSRVYTDRVRILRDGYLWTVYQGDVIAGPATVFIWSFFEAPTLLTLEHWKVTKSK